MKEKLTAWADRLPRIELVVRPGKSREDSSHSNGILFVRVNWLSALRALSACAALLFAASTLLWAILPKRRRGQ